MNSQYKRVSRHRTCIICGKPDWCSYTPDAKISFCARIISNADRVSRTGWGVFYHEGSLFSDSPIPFQSKLPPKITELAPIEIRDFVYRKLIALSPAVNSNTIINGRAGLLERKIFDFQNFGLLPQRQIERNKLARDIRQSLNRNFPDYVRNNKSSLGGLPGFWLDKQGKSRLWYENDDCNPMLVIPYCDSSGLIQACQIRFFGENCKGSARYRWLSTPHKSGGISAGTPLHFVSYQEKDLQKPVLITEGALKAETVRFYRKDFDIIAISGVNCSHTEIIKKCRFRPVLIAFDNDFWQNIYVARAVFQLAQGLYFDSLKFKFFRLISILTWNNTFKGIDNALLNNSAIFFLSLKDWFQKLSTDFQSILNNQFPSSPVFLN